jgi:hypothetical protein
MAFYDTALSRARRKRKQTCSIPAQPGLGGRLVVLVSWHGCRSRIRFRSPAVLVMAARCCVGVSSRKPFMYPACPLMLLPQCGHAVGGLVVFAIVWCPLGSNDSVIRPSGHMTAGSDFHQRARKRFASALNETALARRSSRACGASGARRWPSSSRRMIAILAARCGLERPIRAMCGIRNLWAASSARDRAPRPASIAGPRRS